MALYAGDPGKQRASDGHPHVGANTAVVGAHVTSMCGTFVHDAQLGGLQALGQAGMDLGAQG
jgi:hypothetical protein